MTALMTGQRENSVSSGSMRTSFTLLSDGTLTAVTRTWTRVKMKGFTGAVCVVLLDKGKNPIWSSGSQSYGVDGTWVGRSDRTENWRASVPSDILPHVKGYSILQTHNPIWPARVGARIDQFLGWLNSGEGKGTLELIKSLAVMPA